MISGFLESSSIALLRSSITCGSLYSRSRTDTICGETQKHELIERKRCWIITPLYNVNAIASKKNACTLAINPYFGRVCTFNQRIK